MAKKKTERAASQQAGLSRRARVQRAFSSQSLAAPADLTEEEQAAFAELVSASGAFRGDVQARFAELWDGYVVRAAAERG